MKTYGVIGYKNSGKTGLVEALVTEITGRGLTVSTVKHAHHRVDVDTPGTDSHRHREAGAREVLLVSAKRWALMHELRDTPEPPLDDLLPHLTPVDLVLIEGYKREIHPKIEAHRAATGQPLIAPEDPTVRAIASDTPSEIPALWNNGPILHLDDVPGVADLILAETGLAR